MPVCQSHYSGTLIIVQVKGYKRLHTLPLPQCLYIIFYCMLTKNVVHNSNNFRVRLKQIFISLGSIFFFYLYFWQLKNCKHIKKNTSFIYYFKLTLVKLSSYTTLFPKEEIKCDIFTGRMLNEYYIELKQTSSLV